MGVGWGLELLEGSFVDGDSSGSSLQSLRAVPTDAKRPPKQPLASPHPTQRTPAPFHHAHPTRTRPRYLLKWAAENLLEPADNVFVVRAVPRMRRPGTSFADKNSVQRLAGDALSGLPHITTFNMPVRLPSIARL